MAEDRLALALAEYKKRLPYSDGKGLVIIDASVSSDKKLVIFHLNNKKTVCLPSGFFIEEIMLNVSK
ncbi:MAG: hypothetical protein NTZ49_00200 [Candidatus Parcubacteria bacterium]|nr:hypothetical protein [Candidatus Parcubacteria bacterium]